MLSLVVAFQVASGLEYTDTGVAIVGTTEPLDVNVTAGTSREDLISYEFASYIAVHFAGFNLPEGDSVVISSPDANVTVSHTYTNRGRDQTGTFIASFIPGNSVAVMYTSVGTASAGQGYRITGFSRGYPTMQHESVCGDGDQSLPAKCYAPGTNLSESLPEAYTKAQSVARLLINGTYLCTGWLGGSEGHLFTNHHCFEQEEWALTTDIEFAAESSSCSDQCETQLGCPGTLVATTSTLIADDEDIDYAVVQLPDCVDLSPYGYLQLRESGPVVNESIYVPQHPDGYAKRIVSTIDNGDSTTVLSVGEDGNCGTEQVGHDADTQGGSSGSPLISSNDNLVVGIHHCGGCANTAIDVRTVLADLASKNITIKNLVASDYEHSDSHVERHDFEQFDHHDVEHAHIIAISDSTSIDCGFTEHSVTKHCHDYSFNCNDQNHGCINIRLRGHVDKIYLVGSIGYNDDSSGHCNVGQFHLKYDYGHKYKCYIHVDYSDKENG
ncbi:hypothetical protein PPTG_15062 [Phytophthora nicotianae INRA-310]|uniref:Serine protease n=1 Tax=Phytophthora nicotianae (strain INRA-310) TaxID=761204 RepID=W2PVY3_PHYN3|nr:hypothetical protein PPTG_15062 [Phytophthora nicotianae INRA-310]ETN04389.1 hypothetical protein PPTG_15062 [Phytophthora nicotianae INRA-310]